jgi:Fe-S cluster biogenesis protein NfuA
MTIAQQGMTDNQRTQQDATLNQRIQQVLDDYRPTLYMDGGDVELLKIDEKGVAHVKMLGACIDCPISLLTMKLGIQRLLKENFPEITGVQAMTDIDISALYNRQTSEGAAPLPLHFSSKQG